MVETLPKALVSGLMMTLRINTNKTIKSEGESWGAWFAFALLMVLMIEGLLCLLYHLCDAGNVLWDAVLLNVGNEALDGACIKIAQEI